MDYDYGDSDSEEDEDSEGNSGKSSSSSSPTTSDEKPSKRRTSAAFAALSPEPGMPDSSTGQDPTTTSDDGEARSPSNTEIPTNERKATILTNNENSVTSSSEATEKSPDKNPPPDPEVRSGETKEETASPEKKRRKLGGD